MALTELSLILLFATPMFAQSKLSQDPSATNAGGSFVVEFSTVGVFSGDDVDASLPDQPITKDASL